MRKTKSDILLMELTFRIQAQGWKSLATELKKKWKLYPSSISNCRAKSHHNHITSEIVKSNFKDNISVSFLRSKLFNLK